MSAISTLGTVWRDCVAEGLRLIFIPVGVEDDEEPKDRASETRDDQSPCRGSREEHPAATRRLHSSEEKIRIVLSGLRGEDSIAELCRKEGIAQSLYYSWSKEFLEAGKKRLAGDTARQANTGEVKDLRAEALALKELVADLSLENRLLKKNMTGAGGDPE